MVVFYVRSGGRTHLLQSRGETLALEGIPLPMLSHQGGEVQVKRGMNYYGFDHETGTHHAEPSLDNESLRHKLWVILGLATPWKAALEPELAPRPEEGRSRPSQALVQMFFKGAIWSATVETVGFEDQAVEFFFTDDVLRGLDGVFVRILPGMAVWKPGDSTTDPPRTWREFVSWTTTVLGIAPTPGSPSVSEGLSRPRSGVHESKPSLLPDTDVALSRDAQSTSTTEAREADQEVLRLWLSRAHGLTSNPKSGDPRSMPSPRPDAGPSEKAEGDEHDLSRSIGVALESVDLAALAEARGRAASAPEELLGRLTRAATDYAASFAAVREALEVATEPIALVLQAYLRGFEGKRLSPGHREAFAKGLSHLLLVLERGLRCSSTGCDLPARLRVKGNKSFEFTHEGKVPGHGGKIVVPEDLTIVSRSGSGVSD